MEGRGRCLGEKNFYQSAPYFFSIAGIIFGSIGFTIDHYLRSLNIEPGWFVWSAVAVIMSGIGFFIGGLMKQLGELAAIDPLTNLYNRRHFYTVVEYELMRRQRTLSSLCLAMIDIDDFKAVNDQFGHQTGDNCLRELGRICIENVRTVDTVSRWGGDEFAILFPETDREAAIQAAERVRSAVEAAGDHLCFSTISIGVVCAEEETSLEGMLALADTAMYEAKKVKNTTFVLRGSPVPLPETR
ncbi:MAG: GGDEF domain-containing protein [Negativicutes bacterium]|nr:GGDEF domain-containing protein [Negativicutes bacterium]